MLILDFAPPFPYRNTYRHCLGLYSYKMRYRNMFCWNLEYSETETRCFSPKDTVFHPTPNERVEVSVLYNACSETCCWRIRLQAMAADRECNERYYHNYSGSHGFIAFSG